MPIKQIAALTMTAALIAVPFTIDASVQPDAFAPAKAEHFLVAIDAPLQPADVVFRRSLHVRESGSFTQGGKVDAEISLATVHWTGSNAVTMPPAAAIAHFETLQF